MARHYSKQSYFGVHQLGIFAFLHHERIFKTNIFYLPGRSEMRNDTSPLTKRITHEMQISASKKLEKVSGLYQCSRSKFLGSRYARHAPDNITSNKAARLDHDARSEVKNDSQPQARATAKRRKSRSPRAQVAIKVFPFLWLRNRLIGVTRKRAARVIFVDSRGRQEEVQVREVDVKHSAISSKTKPCALPCAL